MTDIIENAGQPENTAPAAGEKKPENTPKKEKQPMTFKRLYKECPLGWRFWHCF